jgi:hypothetical protein
MNTHAFTLNRGRNSGANVFSSETELRAFVKDYIFFMNQCLNLIVKCIITLIKHHLNSIFWGPNHTTLPMPFPLDYIEGDELLEGWDGPSPPTTAPVSHPPRRPRRDATAYRPQPSAVLQREVEGKGKRSNERRAWHEQESGTPMVCPPTPLPTQVNYQPDASVEPDMKRLRLPRNKNKLKNKNRRIFHTQQMTEIECLRSELSSVHKAYAKEIKVRDAEINELKDNFRCMSNTFADETASHSHRIADLENDLDITEGELSIFQKSEKGWIGISLKLKFILDEIKKIGALPEDHAEWVFPMLDDILIPDVSINVKDEFIPTMQTDNIDWVDSDEEYEEYEEYEEQETDVIGDYLDNETTVHCTYCGEFGHTNNDCPMPTNTRILGSPRLLEKSVTTIQKAWRNHQILKKDRLDRELDDFMYCRRPFNKWEWDSDGHHDDWAIVIQRVWRGFHCRRVRRVYEWSLYFGALDLSQPSRDNL